MILEKNTEIALKEITVKKGQIIQAKGDLNSKVYSVKSGLLRSYSIDKRGREHIYMFAPEGWTIADGAPPEEPCELFIDALESSTLIINEKDPEAKVINRKKAVKRLWVLQQRIVMLMSAPAIERYEHFIETYPNIVQRVPQRMIASYLGITPEALSKVKGDKKRRK